MMFAYALTSPVVHIYFMKLVDPQVLAVANMLSVGLAAIVNATVTKDKFLSWYRKHFFWIVTLDIFSYIIICYAGTEYDATIRFIGLAITDAVSTTLWAVVMRSAVNDVLDGDRLTKWSSLSDGYKLAASFLGGNDPVLSCGHANRSRPADSMPCESLLRSHRHSRIQAARKSLK